MTLEFRPLTMMELRSAPGDILDRVHKDGPAFIVERNGQQMACLVPVSVFLPDIKRSKLNEELDQLRQSGEKPRVGISGAREIQLQFDEKAGQEDITVTIVLPHGYPNTAPRVYASPIVDKVPHRWHDGALCIVGAMTTWNPGKHGVNDILALTRTWLQNYAAWRASGRWAEQESPRSQ
jgi:hypothetical protein